MSAPKPAWTLAPRARSPARDGGRQPLRHLRREGRAAERHGGAPGFLMGHFGHAVAAAFSSPLAAMTSVASGAISAKRGQRGAQVLRRQGEDHRFRVAQHQRDRRWGRGEARRAADRSHGVQSRAKAPAPMIATFTRGPPAADQRRRRLVERPAGPGDEGSRPDRQRQRSPAQAIIAALSVQSDSGADSAPPASSAACSRRCRSVLFAATPPTTARRAGRPSPSCQRAARLSASTSAAAAGTRRRDRRGRDG